MTETIKPNPAPWARLADALQDEIRRKDAQIDDLHLENDRLRDAMTRISATAERCIGESVSEIEDGLVRIVAMCELKPNAKSTSDDGMNHVV